MRSWDRRRWLAATAGAVVVAVAVGLPTLMIPNPIFARMIPLEWWNRPVWLATSVLAGLLLATYVSQGPRREEAPSREGVAGGLLTFFAVGCPTCNKLVVLAIGASGATTWFAALQPVLAFGGLVLLAVALRSRLRGERTCALPTEVSAAADR